MKKLLLVSLVVLLVLSALYGCSAPAPASTPSAPTPTATAAPATPAPTPEPTPSATPEPETSTPAPSPIEFVASPYVTNNMGIWTIYWDVKNIDTKQLSFMLTIAFYDEHQKLLGTASGAMNGINGGTMKTFTAISSDDLTGAKDLDAQSFTVVSSQENEPEVIEFGEPLVSAMAGITSIKADVTNTDSETHSFTVIATFYDDADSIIGVAVGAVNDIAAGDKQVVQMLGNGECEGAASYRIAVDTMTK